MSTSLPSSIKHIGFMIRKHNKILKHGESWMRCIVRYSTSKKDDKTENSELSEIRKYCPEYPDLPNPVRNTEWEYFERIRNPNYKDEPGPLDSSFFTRKGGISKLAFSWLHWNPNIDDTEELMAMSMRNTWKKLVEAQAYDAKTQREMGPDLSAAHMVVAGGGAVKFVGRDVWLAKTADGKFQLPSTYVENLHLEAIDASNTKLTYVALDTLEKLEHLRFLRFSNCEYVDDSCLVRLQRLKHTVEFLDLDNCPRITDCGLTSLHTLNKLQGLRVSKLTGVKHLGLIALLLEEHLAGLQVMGLTENDLRPPTWAHRGERKLVQALLGLWEPGEDGEEWRQEREFMGKYSHDSVAYYSRTIRPVD